MTDEQQKPDFTGLPGFSPEPLPGEPGFNSSGFGNISTEPKANIVRLGEWDVDPDRPLKHRHEVICHMAAYGATSSEIEKEMGISQTWVSILLNNQHIQARIKQIRDHYWGGNIQTRFQNSVPKAMDAVEQIIASADKDSTRLDAAKWLLEKVTGKPRQEIDADGGNAILQLLGALEALKAGAPRAVGEVHPSLTPSDPNFIDVSPSAPAAAPDPLDAWVSAHVPDSLKDKKE